MIEYKYKLNRTCKPCKHSKNKLNFIKIKMNSKQSENYCKDVLPIPQFKGTCWFNSLLMALFYSELMRKFFIKELPNIREQLKKHKKNNSDP